MTWLLPLLMAAAAPQDSQEPLQQARGFAHREYTGGVLSLRLGGDLVQQVDGRTYRIEGLDATLFTSPKSGDPKATRIDVRSRSGSYDSKTGLLTLRGEARLTSADGDDLQSESLTVSRVTDAQGRVIDFKLGTTERFSLTRPRLKVEGVGLDALYRSLNTTVAADGKIEIEGEPRDVQRRPQEPSDTKILTVLKSADPMAISEPAEGGVKLVIPGACSMAQEERRLQDGEWILKRRSMLTAADATFDAAKIPDPADDPIARAAALGWLREADARARFEGLTPTPAELGAAGLLSADQAADLEKATPTLLQITSVTAKGNVQLTGADGERALCDHLEWNRLAGSTKLWNDEGHGQVRVVQGGNIIDADRVNVDHSTNLAVCEGHVHGTLQQEANGPVTDIRAESLKMEGRGPAPESTGTPSVTFQPDVLTVQSRAFSELTTDQVRIRAPMINYDPANGRSVVGGPKTIELRRFDPRGNELPPVRVACEGIAVLDRGPLREDRTREGIVTLEQAVRLIDRDLTLESDRTVINLSERIDPETAQPETRTRVRSYGNVRIRKEGNQNIAADFTDYDMTTGDMLVVGLPNASIRTGDSDLLHTRTTINIEKESLETAPADERVRIVVPRRKKP